jgi:hypothetical protein
MRKEPAGLHVILKMLAMKKSQHPTIQPVALISHYGISYVRQFNKEFAMCSVSDEHSSCDTLVH